MRWRSDFRSLREGRAQKPIGASEEWKAHHTWLSTLEAYAFPTIGRLPINRIGTAEVLKLLLPIWTEKPETARRVLQRVSNVIDYGSASGLRSGENPCDSQSLAYPSIKESPNTLQHSPMPSFSLGQVVNSLVSFRFNDGRRYAHSTAAPYNLLTKQIARDPYGRALEERQRKYAACS